VHAHGDGTAPVHATKTAHQHAGENVPHDHANGDGKVSTVCCGLFCVSAIAQDSPDFATTPVVSVQTVSVLTDVLTGRDPDRINRPPIR
jgi:hypothetical protein